MLSLHVCSFLLCIAVKYCCMALYFNDKLECGPMPNVMAALPNIGGALCSTPQRLNDAHHYRVPCSNAAKTRNQLRLECGPMRNVMAALPNIGGALCSTPQSLADAQYWNTEQ